MPPKKEPAETADKPISVQLREAYEKGRVDGLIEGEDKGRQVGYETGWKVGLEAGKPKLSIFEACRQEAVQLQARDEISALHAIRKIMEQKKAEYGEFMPKADENLLLEAWKRSDSRRRSDSTAPVAPRQSRAPFEGEPSVEYEVVT